MKQQVQTSHGCTFCNKNAQNCTLCAIAPGKTKITMQLSSCFKLKQFPNVPNLGVLQQSNVFLVVALLFHAKDLQKQKQMLQM